MPRSYYEIGKENNCSINNQETYPFYFLITYGVCKKRKYCNRMSEKKNSLLFSLQINLSIFQNPYEFFQFFLRFSKHLFKKKI